MARTEAPLLLEAVELTKRFGGVTALDRMSLQVREGEIVGLIGPNGAGKTSFFNCVTGLARIDEGSILFRGRHRLDRSTCNRILETGVARTFQNLRIFRNMSLLENISIGFHTRTRSGLWDAFLRTRRFDVEERMVWSRGMDLLKMVGLEGRGNQIAANLSYGGQKRLEIARALACEPKLLLLDEPVAGMNPTEKEEIAELVRRIRQKGVSVLVIEHDMRFVMPLCDRVVVMDEGRRIAEGLPGEVRRDARVIQAYLGGD